MPKLPSVKAEDVIKALRKIGFEKVRQKGSHVRLKHDDNRVVTIPIHARKTIGKELLLKILRDLGKLLALLVEAFDKAIACTQALFQEILRNGIQVLTGGNCNCNSLMLPLLLPPQLAAVIELIRHPHQFIIAIAQLIVQLLGSTSLLELFNRQARGIRVVTLGGRDQCGQSRMRRCLV